MDIVEMIDKEIVFHQDSTKKYIRGVSCYVVLLLDE